MSNQNNNGRALEFAFLTALQKRLQAAGVALCIEDNKAYLAAQKAWGSLSAAQQQLYDKAADAGACEIVNLEPRMLENTAVLEIQSDDKGQEGDVRDIVVSHEDKQWFIGLSIKHNHFAVKHSRLSSGLDFGEKWYGIACSDEYWTAVASVFGDLKTYKQNKKTWSEIGAEKEKFYKDILKAFKEEILKQNAACAELPSKLLSYLLGTFDFYKVIAVDVQKRTQIQAFNLNGTLARKGAGRQSSNYIPRLPVPSQILYFDFVKNSCNTLEMCLDKGWHFTFRLHNASSRVEPSFKFDIQCIGLPNTLVNLTASWA